MASAALLLSPKLFASASYQPIRTVSSSTQQSSACLPQLLNTCRNGKILKTVVGNVLRNQSALAALVGVVFAQTLDGAPSASASEFPLWGTTLQLSEPENALSLPTWAVHVSSVVEWISAMALVWQYGEKSGNESWKGLSWGMVLVALQATLTVVGNFTMCIAAYRIYKSCQGGSGTQ